VAARVIAPGFPARGVAHGGAATDGEGGGESGRALNRKWNDRKKDQEPHPWASPSQRVDWIRTKAPFGSRVCFGLEDRSSR
jgi:hypothetical protein